MNEEIKQAKKALDSIIKGARAYWYKPIQIAEILYHDRVVGDVDLNDLESYRIVSKHWRNEVTKALLNAQSSSSNDYQDALFLKQMPQDVIKVLGKENRHPQLLPRKSHFCDICAICAT